MQQPLLREGLQKQALSAWSAPCTKPLRRQMLQKEEWKTDIALQPWLSVGLVGDWSCVCHSSAAAPYPTLELIREIQELGLWL